MLQFVVKFRNNKIMFSRNNVLEEKKKFFGYFDAKFLATKDYLLI